MSARRRPLQARAHVAAAVIALVLSCGRRDLGSFDVPDLGSAGGLTSSGGRRATSSGGRTHANASGGFMAAGGTRAGGGGRVAMGGRGDVSPPPSISAGGETAGGAGGAAGSDGGSTNSGTPPTTGTGALSAGGAEFSAGGGDCGAAGAAMGGAAGEGAAVDGGAAGSAGDTSVRRSCAFRQDVCGVEQESCCVVERVDGGDFVYGARTPFSTDAHVSTFFLDKYEVTRARFFSFLDDYDAWRASGAPSAGSGAHPLVEGSGWNLAWDDDASGGAGGGSGEGLAPTREAIEDAVSTCLGMPFSTVMSIQPVNCVSFFEAEAFCIWDGGRLPTELEWEYAAAGGDENRTYPWGDDAPTHGHAAFDCSAQLPEYPCLIPPVGSYPAGRGRFGQLDLAGSVWEWNLDVFSTTAHPVPCNDCADVIERFETNPRGTRGGSWTTSAEWLAVSARTGLPAALHLPDQGFRCAYDHDPAAP